MPDDPIDKPSGDSPNPEHRLRDLFDEIEREESTTSKRAPQIPSNDEIRAGALDSPIEGPLGPLEIPAQDIDPNEARLMELEKQLEEVTSQREHEVGEIRSEFDQRMSDLDAKIRKMKEEREGKRIQQERQYKASGSEAKGLGLGLTIAYTFIGMPLFGALVGWGLDSWLHTDMYKGILMMVGAAGGLALTVMFLKRADSAK